MTSTNRFTAISTFLFFFVPAILKAGEQSGALPTGVGDSAAVDLNTAVTATGIVFGLGRKWADYVRALAGSGSK